MKVVRNQWNSVSQFLLISLAIVSLLRAESQVATCRSFWELPIEDQTEMVVFRSPQSFPQMLPSIPVIKTAYIITAPLIPPGFHEKYALIDFNQSLRNQLNFLSMTYPISNPILSFLHKISIAHQTSGDDPFPNI